MTLSNNRRLPVLASDATCTGCMACIAVCKQTAIRQTVNEEGHVTVQINNDKCICCLRCEEMCAENKKNYGTNRLSESSVYCGWAQKETFRKEGTSGGVFAALSEIVIQHGGIVIGASFNGRNCTHVSIDRVEDIPKLQKSKYVYSSILNVYREIDEALYRRIVLFTGTGCQVGAVIEYFKDHKFFNNLYTLDVICGGVPSNALVEKFLEDDPSLDGIASFRNKDKYELSVKKDGKILSLGGRPLPLWGYACGMTNRYCCYDCQFAYPHRKSDITIGDLWNYNLHPDEHAKGISTLLIHTTKGEHLLNQARIELKTVEWKDVLYTNKRIVYGKERVYSPRKRLAKNIRKKNYKQFERLYCMKMKPWNVGEFMFKVYYHFAYKDETRKARQYINRILSIQDEFRKSNYRNDK